MEIGALTKAYDGAMLGKKRKSTYVESTFMMDGAIGAYMSR